MSDEFESDKLKELRSKFRTVEGGKIEADHAEPEKTESKIPEHTYAILDIEGEEWMNSGFLIFTSHHVAIMRETEAGAVPVFVVPLHRVKAAELVPEEFLEIED